MKYKTYREIPVSERLPEFEGVHTVVDVDLNMFQAVYDKEFGFIDEFNHTDGITHWLEPYESLEQELKSILELYKECFENYIPLEKQDEATLFLSVGKSGLAQDLAKREK